MNYLMKMTVIGQLRQIMYRYVRQIPNGGDIVDFSLVLSNAPVCVAIKVEDHHAKLHIHTLSEEDPRPKELVEALAKRHPELRFVLYYEHAKAYGTIHARSGKIQTHAEKKRE